MNDKEFYQWVDLISTYSETVLHEFIEPKYYTEKMLKATLHKDEDGDYFFGNRLGKFCFLFPPDHTSKGVAAIIKTVIDEDLNSTFIYGSASRERFNIMLNSRDATNQFFAEQMQEGRFNYLKRETAEALMQLEDL